MRPIEVYNLYPSNELANVVSSSRDPACNRYETTGLTIYFNGRQYYKTPPDMPAMHIYIIYSLHRPIVFVNVPTIV